MARSKSKIKRLRHRWALKAKRRKEAQRLVVPSAPSDERTSNFEPRSSNSA